MRQLALSLVLAACCACAGAAPPTEDSVNELLKISKAERAVEKITSVFAQSVRAGIEAGAQGRTLNEEQRRAVEALPGALEQTMRETFRWDKVRPIYVKIYQDVFTQEEVDGMIAFYKTPAGAAVIEKMPVVMEKSQTMVHELVEPMIERMEKNFEQAVGGAGAPP